MTCIAGHKCLSCFLSRFINFPHKHFSLTLSLSVEEKNWKEKELKKNGSQTQSFHLATSKVAIFCSPTKVHNQISQVFNGLHSSLCLPVSCFIPSEILMHSYFLNNQWIFVCFLVFEPFLDLGFCFYILFLGFECANDWSLNCVKWVFFF